MLFWRRSFLFLLLAVSLAQAVPPRPTARFRRITEPRERAFSILVPDGWLTEGGILRVNPNAAGGAGNSIGAKLDFTVKSDARGAILMRWLPEMRYVDLRGSPVGQMGMFPPGSQYNGMTVYPIPDAASFLANTAFRYAHPQARNPRLAARKPMPGLAEAVERSVAWLPFANSLTFDGAMVTVAYQEGGLDFEERMTAVIQNYGPVGAGMWENKETFLVRTSGGRFEDVVPVVAVIRNSVELDPEWVAGEIRGQIVRSQIALETQRYIQNIDREIVEHRRRVNAQINENMFLMLTAQREYVNPHTGRREYGSNEWKCRWTSPSGEEIYTDDENYKPAYDRALNRSDFKRSPARPR